MAEDWKEVVKMSAEEKAALKYNDPRLDSFTSVVEQRYDLPPGIILAVKNAGERSNTLKKSGEINASSAKAKGVMQFIDSTREAYQHDFMDPLASIDAAGRYFKDLMQRYNGDAKAAIAEYNGGIRAAKAVQAGKEIPFKETRDYLQRIKKFMQKRQTQDEE